MDKESRPRPPADVGVLFVHGMGEQRRADTLVHFGESLQQWLERWLPTNDRYPTAGITRAELSDTAESRPAHAEMRITTASIDSTWVLAESWWAESFQAPSYGDLWRWSFGVVPLAITEHFARRFRRATGWYRPSLERLLAGIGIVMLPFVTVVMMTTLIIGVLPIPRLRTAILRVQKVLVGTVGDSYALIESSIRGAGMRSIIQRDLKWLQTVAGKTVVVAHSQGAAIAHAALRSEQLRPDLLFTFGSGLRKLLVLDAIRRHDRFVVWLPPLGLLLMAAGSWLGYRLIVDDSWRFHVELPQVRALIDYLNASVGFDIAGWRSFAIVGAIIGIGISIASKGEVSIGERSILALMLAAYCALFALLAKAMLAAGWLGYFVILFLVHGGLLLRRGFSVLETDAYTKIDQRLELDPPVKWVDFYAASDPVPNGPLTTATAQFVDSRPVWNVASALRDHSSYWRNTDQFVSAVARAIAATAGIDLSATNEWDEQRLRRAEARRRWRVGWLGVLRFVALVVGILVSQRFLQGMWRQPGDLPSLLQVVFLESMDLVEKIPFFWHLVSDGAKSALVQALWPIWLLLCVWMIYRVFLLAWSWWDRDDIQVLFNRGNYALFSPPFTFLISIVGVVLGISFALAAEFDRELVSLWARDPSIAAIHANFLKGYSESRYGVVTAIRLAFFASCVASFVAALATSNWKWGRRTKDTRALYTIISYGLLGLAVAAPTAWFVFDLGGDPASPPYRALTDRWAGSGAVLILTLVAFLPIIGANIAVGSSTGRTLVARLYYYSGSGPLGLWLARTATNVPDSDLLLRRRAEQLLGEWEKIPRPQKTVTVVREYNCEATAIVLSRAAFLRDSERLLAITDAFPYAALASAEAVAEDDPYLARRILEPHRQTSPGAVRWRIRGIDKRLRRVNTEAQAV